MADLIVSGAGMAGLVAAVQAIQRGADVELREKLDRPGGSMRLSSGVIWRHRDFDDFRADCPAGDQELQRIVFGRLDAGLRWLREIGAPIQSEGTGNPRTVGLRFDPAGMTDALVAAAPQIRFEEPLTELPQDTPVILAGGGFPADVELLREHVTPQADHLFLRASPGATGDGLRLGLSAGGSTGAGLGEIYGRNMPAPPARPQPADFVPAAQLYADAADVTNERGESFRTKTWSQIDVLQWSAVQPRARAWFRVAEDRLNGKREPRTIRSMVDAAERLGARVERDGDFVSVETVAGVTSTLGGLVIDEHAAVAPRVFAAGGDAGGIATGGYASGLAAALVFGRIAADAALGIG